MREIEVNDKQEGYKLKKLCMRYLDTAPQSFIYKMLRKKNIVLNDKKATGDEVLKSGDVIKLYLSEETINSFKSESGNNSQINNQKNNISFKKLIIYEDKDIIIFNKPVNMLSQKAKPEDYSMNEMLIDYLLEEGDIQENELSLFKPSVCNRLDRNTSGLLLAGKTSHGSRYLSRVLKDRTIQKYYLAVVKGSCSLSGIKKAFISKDRKQNLVTVSENEGDMLIETGFEVLDYNKKEDISLLRIELFTGKSHQIRAHLKYLGYPIIGDIKYGSDNRYFRDRYKVKSQLLMAYKVVFPAGEEVVSGKEFMIKPKDDIYKLFDTTKL